MFGSVSAKLGKELRIRHAVVLLMVMASLVCARGFRVHHRFHASESSTVRSVHQEHGPCFEDDDSPIVWAAPPHTWNAVPPICERQTLPSDTRSIVRLELKGFRYNRPPPAS